LPAFPENIIQIRLEVFCAKLLTDRQTNRQTRRKLQTKTDWYRRSGVSRVQKSACGETRNSFISSRQWFDLSPERQDVWSNCLTDSTYVHEMQHRHRVIITQNYWNRLIIKEVHLIFISAIV